MLLCGMNVLNIGTDGVVPAIKKTKKGNHCNDFGDFIFSIVLFQVIGEQVNLDVSDNIRAMQVIGPAGEALYLTQVKAEVPTFGRDKEGNPSVRPMKEINGTWFMNFEVPLFYKNPLAGEYQKYVGGIYHATEIFDFSGDMDELLDADQDKAYPGIAQAFLISTQWVKSWRTTRATPRQRR
jgi:hypothetical protein